MTSRTDSVPTATETYDAAVVVGRGVAGLSEAMVLGPARPRTLLTTTC
jgi:hypothetical protein